MLQIGPQSIFFAEIATIFPILKMAAVISVQAR
jgi:hypothetical protein